MEHGLFWLARFLDQPDQPDPSFTRSAQFPMIKYSPWIAYCTIVRKEVTRFMRIWQQSLVPPMVTAVLYLVIFGTLIGERIGPMAGIPYIEFLTPGLVLMAVITNAYNNTSSSFFSAKFQRYIEELLISPTPHWVILLGYISGGVARGMLVGAGVCVVTFAFGARGFHAPVIAFAVALLTAILFSLGGFLNGLFARKFDDVSSIPAFVLTPLIYLGGIFYSVSLLPEFWQKISWGNPIFYMISAARYGFLGYTDINLGLSFVIIVGFIIGLFGLILWLMARGVGTRS